ncbi:hypothetical protein EDD27_2637 [Nonomuraea polychroma]|uniref:Uncharacterized protein n=2 Tax=Nonomuraea polychroma TaxID=46176 RepID=A0A438M3S1_9ACTN|nr:hypothetical protein EDD27_2637 [Nonomuraea polychroma]
MALPAHFAMTAGIIATAAGVGVVTADPSAHLHGVGWVLGGGLAVCFAASKALGIAMVAERWWTWGGRFPHAHPARAAALSGLIEGWMVVALLLVVALWRVAYRLRGGSVASPTAA